MYAFEQTDKNTMQTMTSEVIVLRIDQKDDEETPMQDLPHQYHVNASAEAEGNVILKVDDLPQLISAAPKEFDGPGDQWSPEHLLTAAVADCFILTFRAVAKASRLEWNTLEVTASGILERIERQTKFTRFAMSARLKVPAETDADKARKIMEKSEANCMITNSLSAEVHLQTDVITGG